jgi:hypothetical protein
METNWAAEHLQTIRTLMERSALYRRALAPISTCVGCVGIVAAVGARGVKIDSFRSFTIYWMAVAVVALSGALVLVRRQAIRQGEPFWSPPTRRVAQAMIPALLLGVLWGLLFTSIGARESSETAQNSGDTSFISGLLIVPWAILYGLALHAAGFFMPRGIRLFAWIFILGGLVVPVTIFWPGGLKGGELPDLLINSPNCLMGIIFGASHLAYGIYLYFTERKNEA